MTAVKIESTLDIYAVVVFSWQEHLAVAPRTRRMSIAAFDSLPWDSICYAAITVCCIAFVFKHCFETVEKIATLAVLLLAAVGAAASYHYIQEHGWKAAVVLLQSFLQHKKEQLPDVPREAAANDPVSAVWNAIWARQ